MKLTPFLEQLMRNPLLRENDRRPMTLVIPVYAPGSIGGSPCVEVEAIDVGFDWNAGKIFLRPKGQLTLLTPDDLGAINASVKLGQSWHSYQEYKRSSERHDQRLQWLSDEQAVIKQLLTQEGVRYTIRWPDLGEEMADYFHTPKMAIDNAMRLNNERTSNDSGQQLPDLPA